jgi:hypothetical protein
VRVSLAQTGRWLQTMGRVPDGLQAPDLASGELSPWMQTSDSPFGKITAMAPVERMAETPPAFELPPVPLGTHLPAW